MSHSGDYVDALLAGDEANVLNIIDTLADRNEAYAGGKRALTRWMRQNMARCLANGIRMNAIAPGYITTPLNDKIEADPELGEVNQAFAASIPVGRKGEPEDVSRAAAFLLGTDSSFIANAALFVDGGYDALIRPNDF